MGGTRKKNIKDEPRSELKKMEGPFKSSTDAAGTGEFHK